MPSPARTELHLLPATAARTSPSWVKSRCGGPRTASTPGTHDQPEQDGCRQLGPSANTTSTEVSPHGGDDSIGHLEIPKDQPCSKLK